MNTPTRDEIQRAIATLEAFKQMSEESKEYFTEDQWLLTVDCRVATDYQTAITALQSLTAKPSEQTYSEKLASIVINRNWTIPAQKKIAAFERIDTDLGLWQEELNMAEEKEVDYWDTCLAIDIVSEVINGLIQVASESEVPT